MTHNYSINTKWTGNQGQGTSSYTSYSRNHVFQAKNKTTLEGSADTHFRGDDDKYNPEEYFLSSISNCHMLWYLHLCAEEGITVVHYEDNAQARMEVKNDGSGKFIEALLQPIVSIKEADKVEMAKELHHKANQMCFIANSCNFPILHKATIAVLQEEIA